MTDQEFDMMVSLLECYERRFRDTGKQGHCFSIEHRFNNGSQTSSEFINLFSEDAMIITLRAWGCLGRKCPFWQSVVAVSFGIGAKCTSERNNRYEEVKTRFGEKLIQTAHDKGLEVLLEAIKTLAGDKYEKLFLGVEVNV